MPSLIGIGPYSILQNLFRKNWVKPITPEPNGFVADINTMFVLDVFDLAQAEWKTNIVHYGQLDNFGTGFEIFERIAVCNIIEYYRLPRFNQVPLT